MGKISDLIADERYQRRLRDGRGKAAKMMVYRGKAEGHSIDDGMGGTAVAGIEQCIDELADAVAMPLRSASVFSSALRCTMTVRFAIGELDDDLAIYHDTTTGETRFQIIHPDRMEVDAGSQSELLALHGNPEEVLALHFAQEDVGDVAASLHRIGLTPVAPTEIRREVYSLELQEA